GQRCGRGWALLPRPCAADDSTVAFVLLLGLTDRAFRTHPELPSEKGHVPYLGGFGVICASAAINGRESSLRCKFDCLGGNAQWDSSTNGLRTFFCKGLKLLDMTRAKRLDGKYWRYAGLQG